MVWQILIAVLGLVALIIVTVTIWYVISFLVLSGVSVRFRSRGASDGRRARNSRPDDKKVASPTRQPTLQLEVHRSPRNDDQMERR